MGYNNVNVNVSGPIQPTSTYKTKVLKGNHSFASQVTEPNMKYVIKYNFDLDGEEVTIPENCILEFDGGSLSNGVIITDETTKITGIPKILCDIEGNVFGKYIDITWLGAVNDKTIDSYNAIQRALDWAASSPGMTVYVPAGDYGISQTLLLKNVNTATCHIVGDGSGFNCKSRIIAIAAMDLMLTVDPSIEATLKDNRTSFKNICFDGNRTGTYYSDDSFNGDSTTLAKGGIYIQRYVYTSCEGLYMKDINGVAFAAGHCWAAPFNKCVFQRCDYGFELKGIIQAECISECEFNTLRYCGIKIYNVYGNVIRDNTFEVIGSCAICVLAVQNTIAGSLLIEGNYFEACCKTGVSNMYDILGSYIGVKNFPKTYFDILVSGTFKEVYFENEKVELGSNYPTGNITINSNTFQHSIHEGFYDCLIFGVTLNNSSIVNNSCNNDIPILMSPGKLDCDRVVNVNISNNVLIPNRTLMSKRYLVYKYSDLTLGTQGRFAADVYTEDALTDGSTPIKGNLFGMLFRNIYLSYITQTNKKYHNLKVYSIGSSNVTCRFLYFTEYYNAANGNEFLPEDYVLEVMWFESSNNGTTWSIKRFNFKSGMTLNFDLTANTLVTLPVIRLAGSPKFEVDGDVPILVADSAYLSELRNSFIAQLGEKLYVPYDDTVDYYECVVVARGAANWVKVKNGVAFGTTSDRPASYIIGKPYYNTTTNINNYWNGTDWVDATGATV